MAGFCMVSPMRYFPGPTRLTCVHKRKADGHDQDQKTPDATLLKSSSTAYLETRLVDAFVDHLANSGIKIVAGEGPKAGRTKGTTKLEQSGGL
jgi:hypothetical protein